jgi:hypothetical protein
LVEPTHSADCPEGLDQDSALWVLGSSGDSARFLRPRILSPPLSFGATAEYNRSGQPRAPLLLLGSAIDSSNPPCAGQGEYPGIETTVKTAIAHPAFRLVRSLLKGACHRHFRFPSSVPNGFRCRIAEPVFVCEPFSSGRNLSREGHSTLEV